MPESRSALRLRSPYPVVIRPVRGKVDLAVVIGQGLEGWTLSLWHGASLELQPDAFPQTTWSTTITTDGRYVLALDDPDGSELGHLHAFPIARGRAIDLTPDRVPYTMRGLDCGLDGRTVLLTAADDHGFFALMTDVSAPSSARVVFESPNETWTGMLSADSRLAALETTDHNPGMRRFAVTVLDTATREVVGTLSDGPLGPVRPVRFSQVDGDSRLLASTEASGFARPVVWDPTTGERVDVELADLVGDVVALDWHAPTGRLLLAHVEDGVHRLLEHHLATGRTDALAHPPGSYFEPDVGDVFPVLSASYYAYDGTRRLVRGSWESPLEVLESRGAEEPSAVLPPTAVPPAAAFTTHMVTSRDGTRVQLWVGRPSEPAARKGTILEVHGGPNLVTPDRYDASAQAWVDEGWVFASLNYRGSVTFGREFREKYWGRVGEGEIDDIAAAVEWLEQHELATSGSVFITGPSYGGFLTLMAMGRLPELFAGGFAHVAQADWLAAYPDMNPALQTAWRGFIGCGPEEDPDRWHRASPIAYVDAVRAPVWLNQGAFDTRTPPRQAVKYADALRACGGDVVIELFPGGHVPGGLAAVSYDHARMTALAERALSGERWDASAAEKSAAD